MSDLRKSSGRTGPSASPAARAPRSSKPRRWRTFGYDASSGHLLAPLIDIEVVAPDGRLWQDSALIDTGADTSAFPEHWLKRLGILKKDCEFRRFTTAGGIGKQWRHPDRLQANIAGRQLLLEACFVNTPVVLLGREDFLMHFEVAFDQRNSRFRIRPY